MAEFRKNKKITNFLYAKPFLVFLAIVVVLFAINIFSIAGKSAETKRSRDLAVAKMAELNQKQADLETDIQKLETDSGKEEIIRDKFRAVKEGEGLIVITDDPNTPPAEPVPQKIGFWDSLRNFFK